MAMVEDVRLIKEKDHVHTPFGFKITRGVITINRQVPIQEAAKIMKKHNIGALIVEENKKMVGIISERDIVYRVAAKGQSPKQVMVEDIMTKKVITINLKEGIEAIHDKIKNVSFRHLPVKEGDKVIGMVSNRDLLYLKQLKTKRRG